MFLLVAFFAVLFAWIGARREFHRTNVRGEIRTLELQRDFAAERSNDPVEGEHWRRAVLENEAMLEAKRRELGERGLPKSDNQN